MFFKFSTSSKLEAFQLHQYQFVTEAAAHAATQDVLEIATILLTESVKTRKSLRYEAGSVLTQWMQHNQTYQFGTTSLRILLNDNVDLAIISMAAQIHYCVSHEIYSTYTPETQIAIWSIIAKYVAAPEHKVKRNNVLTKLVDAHNIGSLDTFLQTH